MSKVQNDCLKELDHRGYYYIKVTAASKAGHMDSVACINSVFYGFEFKEKNDYPSELQKDKINKLNANGGRGYFIRSKSQLIDIIDNNTPPVNYELKKKVTL